MSNSSDALMLRMAEEWRLLSSEIAGLAETAGHGRILDATTMIKLQAFDAVIQNIQTQSRLLEALVQGNDLPRLLEEIPLPGVRARLKAAFGMTSTRARDDAGVVQLFANGDD